MIFVTNIFDSKKFVMCLCSILLVFFHSFVVLFLLIYVQKIVLNLKKNKIRFDIEIIIRNYINVNREIIIFFN